MDIGEIISKWGMVWCKLGLQLEALIVKFMAFSAKRWLRYWDIA